MFASPYPYRCVVPGIQVPYTGDIPGGLQPGKQIIIKGVVVPHCNKFRVDLFTRHNHTALHINPRFSQGQVVRNSDINGWGPEERHGPFPFRRGEAFEMIITTEADHFKVAVNGEHNYDYNHRIPISEITRLGVSGDVDCHEITFFGGARPFVDEVYNPSVPSTVPISGGAHPGKLIHITGSVPDYAGRFEIDLQSGPDCQPNDIALHFNPRWNDPYSAQPIIIRTHRHGGAWGAEDRHHPPFPFQKGQNFEVLILCEPTEWKVAVNGQHFISYPHHVPLHAVDHIGFVGDVHIHTVRQYH